MATLSLAIFPPISAKSQSQRKPHIAPIQQGLKFPFSAHPFNRVNFKPKTRVTGDDFLGDFGARDPFPAELESGFAEKVIGNVDTEHKILIPNAFALSLSKQSCSPVSPMDPPMAEEDAKKLLKKVLGWKLLDEDGLLKLQCLWRVRDFKCGVELVNRIQRVTESDGHFPHVHVEDGNQVRAELWTASIRGLSMNDFIVAAKIDEIKTSDLAPKKRVWA